MNHAPHRQAKINREIDRTRCVRPTRILPGVGVKKDGDFVAYSPADQDPCTSSFISTGTRGWQNSRKAKVDTGQILSCNSGKMKNDDEKSATV